MRQIEAAHDAIIDPTLRFVTDDVVPMAIDGRVGDHCWERASLISLS